MFSFFVANISNESCGISVIFTDEVGESTIVRRSPPRTRPTSLVEHGHGGLGISNGKATLVVPNGCNPTTPPPEPKQNFSETSMQPGELYCAQLWIFPKSTFLQLLRSACRSSDFTFIYSYTESVTGNGRRTGQKIFK